MTKVLTARAPRKCRSESRDAATPTDKKDGEPDSANSLDEDDGRPKQSAADKCERHHWSGSCTEDHVGTLALQDAKRFPQINKEQQVSLGMPDEIGLSLHVLGERDAIIQNVKMLERCV
jgi:hypothetical protein